MPSAANWKYPMQSLKGACARQQEAKRKKWQWEPEGGLWFALGGRQTWDCFQGCWALKPGFLQKPHFCIPPLALLCGGQRSIRSCDLPGTPILGHPGQDRTQNMQIKLTQSPTVIISWVENCGGLLQSIQVVIDGHSFGQQFPAEDLAPYSMNYTVWLFHEIVPATDSAPVLVCMCFISLSDHYEYISWVIKYSSEMWFFFFSRQLLCITLTDLELVL